MQSSVYTTLFKKIVIDIDSKQQIVINIIFCFFDFYVIISHDRNTMFKISSRRKVTVRTKYILCMYTFIFVQKRKKIVFIELYCGFRWFGLDYFVVTRLLLFLASLWLTLNTDTTENIKFDIQGSETKCPYIIYIRYSLHTNTQ